MTEDRSFGYDISGSAQECAPSEFSSRVLAILDESAALYRDRNAVYKDNFRMVGKVLEALFPEGRPGLRTASDYDRWHIFELLIVKLTRYASNFDNPHEDSLLDQLPYIGILGALDQELRERRAEDKDFQGMVDAALGRLSVSNLEKPEYDERFCDQCSGPFTADQGGDPQYGGHWDTCPNRPKRAGHTHIFEADVPVEGCPACDKRMVDAQEKLDEINGRDDDREGFVD
jgi:hypothetical protein